MYDAGPIEGLLIAAEDEQHLAGAARKLEALGAQVKTHAAVLSTFDGVMTYPPQSNPPAVPWARFARTPDRGLEEPSWIPISTAN